MRILSIGFSEVFIKELEKELSKYFICIIDVARNMHDAVNYIDFRDYELVLISKLSALERYVHFAPTHCVKFALEDYVKELKKKNTKIIMIATNRSEQITFFSWGADDVVKYYGYPDLIAARVLSTMRHLSFTKIKIDKLVIDITNRKIVYEERNVFLDSKTFEVFVYLLLRQSRVISKHEIINGVWEEPEYVSEITVEHIINEIQIFLCQLGSNIISIVGNKGYRFSLLYEVRKMMGFQV